MADPTLTTEHCPCRSQNQCHAKGSCDFVAHLMFLTLGFSLLTAVLGSIVYVCLRRFHVRRYQEIWGSSKDPTVEIGLEFQHDEEEVAHHRQDDDEDDEDALSPSPREREQEEQEGNELRRRG
eukprot:gb/GECG01007523.1/.p1 GENE.gb/GECG01007523.1/~~gb/GECG01007523.1/.p1  ORF type:complete len:123 (+),score=16.05 gb/GECG01007523.1/:1-369(+)